MSNLDSLGAGPVNAGPVNAGPMHADSVTGRLQPGGGQERGAQAPALRPRRDSVATKVYLDHAATTPMLPEAFEAMVTELVHTGNPSSLHNAGRRARRVIEESREMIAHCYGGRPSEVIFTSGGPRADNPAIQGAHRSPPAENP